MADRVLLLGLVGLCFCLATASDHSPLQDFCVADSSSNGTVLKYFASEWPYMQKSQLGQVNYVAIAALSSQNPGVIPIANVVFGSNPDMSTDILVKAFQLNKNVVGRIQSKF
ncbi:hypothetical protein RJ640_003516 [Escallonia rubra]|uniref:Cupin type-1 domain-containing protein n=1 Tax=Escallonia rubra TaxID=112253 RepID=A0AA88U6K4_9ASTE|nr:hypothetical protein RJ640_003516 [Escallonia rubra]